MTDRQKIIESLNGLKEILKLQRDIQGYGAFIGVVEDAAALLKEQEPIEPVDDGHGSLICGNQGYGCGCVGRYDLITKVVEKYCNFCPECGRKVKWE